MRNGMILGAMVLFGSLIAALGADGVRVLEVGQRPESVTRGFDGKLYTTVMMSPSKEGDAVVRQVEGKSVTDFASGMDEPKGITSTGDFLVTTDVTKLWKIDSEGNASVLAGKSDFPHKVRYLNDIVAAPDGQSVYVSDMGANTKMFGPDGLWSFGSKEARRIPAVGRIYEVTMDGEVRVAVKASRELLNPNGVTVAPNGDLLIAEFFYGNVLRRSQEGLKVLRSGLRGGDGIEVGPDGSIFVSSWTQGKIWRLGSDGKRAEVVHSGMQSAADFYLDKEDRQLVVPDMLAGTLTFLNLN